MGSRTGLNQVTSEGLMSAADNLDPWPRMREVVASAVMGLHGGRFIEETLEALCVQLGATSAWSTLETKSGGGPMHRSRTAGFRGVPPAVLAQHVTDTLSRVQVEPKTVAGPVPYAPMGSFAAVPLWSLPTSSRRGRTLIGAMYLEFPGDEGEQSAVLEFIECVGSLLGGMIAQQTLIEATREDLWVERAKDHNEHHLSLDELLAPESMATIREELRAAVASNASIMLSGESGTGKTQLATAFARASNREPIVRATLGLADDLNTITSELFGHERGAFSGAVSKRKGLVEYANKGTLILDEVLNLSRHAQQLLLDFTQFGSYRPLGYQGREPKKADVRLISVTNGDVLQAIADNRFRQDLYYRLATVPIVLPPLRERREDIPQIAVRYLNRTDGRNDWELDGSARELLSAHHLRWGGNIRELEAVLERARNRVRVSESADPVIEARHLDLEGEHPLGAAGSLTAAQPAGGSSGNEIPGRWKQLAEQKDGLDVLEKGIIEDTLAACEGIVARAARMLSVPRTGLISRMATLEIDPEKFKNRRE
ncbi:MAG: sigma-54-dependent Fis family transcriptional regulator [Deltaproteobacteria bacterium]|nr:sigma-54-dependent Fis family transcriptional regulator [Deltaproteobacteria bacterium]